MNTLRYSFNLSWDELPSELQEEKINEYIRANIQEYREGMENENSSDAAVLQDTENRRTAERAIRARFPIYF